MHQLMTHYSETSKEIPYIGMLEDNIIVGAMWFKPHGQISQNPANHSSHNPCM